MFEAELESLLLFAASQNRVADLVPRLNSKQSQYHEALNELRVAFFLHDNGFAIKQWEPPGLNGKVGEFLIATREDADVFVEVKSPGWESELSDGERKGGRVKQPKYLGSGGGAVAPYIGHIRERVRRSYSKFAPGASSLLVIAGDFFFPLDFTDTVDLALYDHELKWAKEPGLFTIAKYSNLGGVAIFETDSEGKAVEYKMRVFGNPLVSRQSTLPNSILSLQVS